MASPSPSAKKKAPRAGKKAAPLSFTDKITTINPTTSKPTPTTTAADSNGLIGPILDPILAPSSANRSAAGGHLTSVKLFETKGKRLGMVLRDYCVLFLTLSNNCSYKHEIYF